LPQMLPPPSGRWGSVGIANGLAVEEEVAKKLVMSALLVGCVFRSNKVGVGHIATSTMDKLPGYTGYPYWD